MTKSLETSAPLLLFLLKERHQMARRLVPVSALLNPFDWYELQREIMNPDLFASTFEFRAPSGSDIPSIHGMPVDVDHGVAEGWAILEFRPPSGSDIPSIHGMPVDVDHGVAEGWAILVRDLPRSRLNMRHFRCTDHEDCRRSYALGMACIADREPR